MNKNILSALILILIVAGIVFFSAKQNVIEKQINLVTGPIIGSVNSTSLGEYLTDSEGMTLYLFTDDKKLESTCYAECEKNWPPFIYDNKDLKGATDFLSKKMNVITRKDGTYQYAYGEQPLYYYAGDKNVGQTAGNGMNSGKWSIVLIQR